MDFNETWERHNHKRRNYDQKTMLTLREMHSVVSVYRKICKQRMIQNVNLSCDR